MASPREGLKRQGSASSSSVDYKQTTALDIFFSSPMQGFLYHATLSEDPFGEGLRNYL